jgi:hypothetical protein
MSDDNLHIEYFNNVWDAIEPAKRDDANMKARTDLMKGRITNPPAGYSPTPSAQGRKFYMAGVGTLWMAQAALTVL